MKVNLSDHFDYKKIFRFTIAPILMMIFVSLYSIADGLIIANCSTNPNSFAGVNLIYPVTMLVGGLGFMFGAGGAALASKRLGEGKKDDANNVFTNMVLVTIVVGLILSIVGFFCVEPLANWMGKLTGGTTPGMIEEAIKYGRVLMLGQVGFMLQFSFQSFFIVDERPVLGFIFALGAGITNVVFDLIFIIPLNMGALGAAIATVMGFTVGGIGPVIYFSLHKNGNIHFAKPKIDFPSIGKSCRNGLGEFVNNISMSFIGIIFNIQLLRYAAKGQLAVEAYGIIMYVILIFTAIFIGYSTTMAPVVSYHYGAKNVDEMRNVVRRSEIIIVSTSIIVTILGIVLARPLATIYAAGDQELIDLTTRAMRIWSVSFLFIGLDSYVCSLFTALNNGLISLLISFSRTFILELLFLLTLPLAMGVDGVWWSVGIADGITAILCIVLLLAYKKRYQY